MKTMLIFLSIFMVLLINVAHAGTYTSSAHGLNVNRQTIDAKYSDYATGNCAHCHEAHASLGGSEPAPTGGAPDNVLLFTVEETLCETCHDAGGPATNNILTQIDKTYAHPTDDYSGRHDYSESTVTNMDPNNYADGANRHAECIDCHNPHAAGSTVHTAGTNAVASTSPLYMTSGIGVTNGGAWTVPAYTEIPASTGISKEYQLCFKCHSSWTTLPAGGQNTALQFNKANKSYHPVEDAMDAAGTGSAGVQLNWQVKAPWFTGGPGKTMYCSDCHGSETSGDPAGPHGSTLGKVLKGYWPLDPHGALWTLSDIAGDPNFFSENLCAQCHPLVDAAAPNYQDRYHHHGNHKGPDTPPFTVDAKCVNCHTVSLHGSNTRQRFIVDFADNDPDYNYGAPGAKQGYVTSFTKVADGNYSNANCTVDASAYPVCGNGFVH